MAQYATLQEAEEYFSTRLHSRLWETSAPADRTAALVTATRQIDRLNFTGLKNAAWAARQANCDATDLEIITAGAAQELEFPRGRDTAVPNDIKIACMEIAYNLLDGRDPQEELEALTVTSQGFSSVRNNNNRDFLQEHLQAGIVSTLAWAYLRPYLREEKSIKVSRVS